MGWFKLKSDNKQVRFIAMLESGKMYDGHAITMQTQVIVEEVNASIRNRKPVPIYYHRAEDNVPVWGESAHIETGLSVPPGYDGRYWLSDALHLWKAFKSGIETYTGGWSLSNKHLALASYVVAGLVVLCCMYLTGLNLRPEEAPPNPASQEIDHGFIDDIPSGPGIDGVETGPGAEGDAGAAEGGPTGGPGQEGAGDGQEQPLATPDGGGAEGDTAQGPRASP